MTVVVTPGTLALAITAYAPTITYAAGRKLKLCVLINLNKDITTITSQNKVVKTITTQNRDIKTITTGG